MTNSQYKSIRGMMDVRVNTPLINQAATTPHPLRLSLLSPSIK
ncbi:hypothetical protein [Calothrix sp. PCC 6303]|nr:hypothetical protein [Calothrix sp. PCC 6303]